MVTVERIASVNEWVAHESEWEDLCRRAGRTEVYLTHRWLTSWYRHFGQAMDLYVLIVKKGSQWIGAMPLVRMAERRHGVPVRTLQFPINQESANLRCDGIFSADKAEGMSAIIRYLECAADEWDKWDLSGLLTNSPVLSPLRQALETAGWSMTPWKVDRVMYYLPVHGSWEALLKSKSQNFRRNLKRAESRMQEVGPVELERYRSLDELSKGIPEFVELERRSTKASREGVIRVDGPVRGFLQSLVESFGQSGDCRLDILKIGGRPVAALIFLCAHGKLFGTYTFYGSDATQLSPGRVLFSKVLEHIWAQGVREVDFNGRTPFVQAWASQLRSTLTCTVYNRSVQSRGIQIWEQSVSPTLRRVRRKAARISFTPLPQRGLRVTGQPASLPLPLQHPSCCYYENGRTALACGLEALPLRPGDEVLFPAYHCGSELDVLLERGYAVHFYPVGIDLTVSIDSLQAGVSERTKAVYLIHYLGWPQDVAPIAAWCRERGLLFIEDCAQALYGTISDRLVGQHGDLAIFSLHKFLPLQDGGAAVFNQPPAGQPNRGATPGWKDRVGSYLQYRALRCFHGAGWRASLGEMACHLLAAVARRVGVAVYTPMRAMSERSRRVLLASDHEAISAARRDHYRTLLEVFSEAPGLRPFFPVLAEGVVPLLFPVWVEYPPPFLQAMEQAGIEAGLLWSSVHPAFPLDEFQTVLSLKLHLVVLPLHQHLTRAEVLRIAAAVTRYVCLQELPAVPASQNQPTNLSVNFIEVTK